MSRKSVIIRYRYILIAMMSFCSFLAINIDPSKSRKAVQAGNGLTGFFSLLSSELMTVHLSQFLAAVAIAYLFHKFLFQKDRGYSHVVGIISFVLSGFLLAGMSLSNFHDFRFIISCKKQFVIAMVVFVGLCFIVYSFITVIYRCIDHLKQVNILNPNLPVKLGWVNWIKAHYFLFSVCVLLLVWIVSMLPFFPGSVPHDGRYQLDQYFGYYQMNLHHPYYATILMGTIYKIGRDIGGIYAGCIFYVLFQSVFGAVIFAKVCKYVFEKSHRLWAANIILLFYAFVPAWWTYMQTIDKDAIFFISFTWFVLEYIYTFLEKNASKSAYIQMMISGIATCIFRNDAKYVLVIAILFWLIWGMNRKRIALLTAFIIVAGYIGLNAIPTRILNLHSDNKVEALALPLQQIARYTLVYGDELTDEERDTINRVVGVDGIENRYDPENADSVKNVYKLYTTTDDILSLADLWKDKLLEHPTVFFTAAMNNVYGYTDPFYFYNDLSNFQLYNKESINEEMDANVVYSEYVFPLAYRDVVRNLVKAWSKIPILSFLINPGAYTWLGFILIGYNLKKREWRKLLLFIIPVLLTCICFVSPVNGLLRYSLPIMAISPLYILVSLSGEGEHIIDANKN